jgi:hypothetical protein
VPTDPSDTVSALQRLKQKIQVLTEEQSKALKSATYLGITPDQARQYDERRNEITELMQEFLQLQQRSEEN